VDILAHSLKSLPAKDPASESYDQEGTDAQGVLSMSKLIGG
jgi:hypothetical protein